MPESINVSVKASLQNATQLERQFSDVAKKAGRNFKVDLGSSAKDINALSQPLGRITGQADEFTKSIEASNARVIAFGASVGIINGLVQSFKGLVNVTIEVEANLAKINSILNTNAAGLDSLKGSIFQIAKETGQSFDIVSNAALELSRQGLGAEDVVKRLNDSLILSRLSGLSAADAVSGLTAAVNSFSKAGLSTGDVLNKISNAANKFAVSERDLIEGFKRSASVAEQAGVSIDELGGIITAVQQRTARGGAVIGNSFKTIFTRIGRADNLELLRSVGVEVSDLQGNIKPATQLISGLAKQLEGLSDIEVRSITEKIGGGFQIAPLLAALADYNDANGVAVRATEAFANASDEAYKKNIILNQTLAAGINLTKVNIEELANQFGELGLIDPFKDLLAGLNLFIDAIRGIGETISGSDLASSLFKGFTESAIKIGISAVGAVVFILSKKLATFGINSFKTFLGLNKSAKELENTQKNIVSTLLQDKDIRNSILKIENSSLTSEEKRLKQAGLITLAVKEQLAGLEKVNRISTNISKTVLVNTKAIRKAQKNAESGSVGSSAGGYIANAADGFLPINKEKSDIAKGVGKAPNSAKTVIIDDFKFGAGKTGTMVANDSEYIVRDYAGGGDAIFNRDMVEKFGVPEGAKQLNAAKGYIPNYAGRGFGAAAAIAKTGATNLEEFEKSKFVKKVPGRQAYTFNDGTNTLKLNTSQLINQSTGKFKAARNANVASKSGKTEFDAAPTYSIDTKKLGGIALISPRFEGPKNVADFDTPPIKLSEISQFKDDKTLSEDQLKKKINLTNVYATNTPGGQDIEGLTKGINSFFAEGIVNLAGDLYGGFFDPASGGQFSQALQKELKGKQILPPATEGNLFEAASKVALNSFSDISKVFDQSEQGRPFDFQNSEAIQDVFGIKALKGESKRGGETNFKGSKQVRDVAKKVFNDEDTKTKALSFVRKNVLKPEKKNTKKNSAGGYIPNFANRKSPIDEAIEREQQAGVPVNQIRINQNGKLRNSKNPNGLAVTNTRDEPTGRIPRNASLGYIPNFAAKTGTRNPLELIQAQSTLESRGEGGGIEAKGIQKELDSLKGTLGDFNKSLDVIVKDTKDKVITQKEANEKIDELVKNLNGSSPEIKNLSKAGGKANKESLKTAAKERLVQRGGEGAREKAQEKSIQSFLAIGSAAFTAENTLKAFAETTEGAGKQIAEAGAGAARTVLIAQGIQAAGLDQKSLGKEQGESGLAFAKRFGDKQGESFGKSVELFGRKGAAASLRRGSGAGLIKQGSSKGIAKVFSLIGKAGPFVGKTVGLFSRLVPLIGPLVVGFQAVNSALKLFGFDLGGTITKFGTKILESIGLIDSPAEKAAKSLEKFGDSLDQNLLKGQGGQNTFAQTGTQILTQVNRREAELKDPKLKNIEDEDELRAELFRKAQRGSGALNISGINTSNLDINDDAIKSLIETSQENFTRGILNLVDDVKLTSADLTDASQVQELVALVKGGVASEEIKKLEAASSNLLKAQLTGDDKKIKDLVKQQRDLSKQVFDIVKAEKEELQDIVKLRAEILNIQIKGSLAESKIISSVKTRKEAELELQKISLNTSKNKQLELDLQLRSIKAQREGAQEINALISKTILDNKKVKELLEGDQDKKIGQDRFLVIKATIDEIAKLDLSETKFSDDFAKPLEDALLAFTGQETLSKEIVDNLKAQIEQQQKTLQIQRAAEEVAQAQNAVYKDRIDIIKEEERILQQSLNIQNQITKSRLEASNIAIDRSEKSTSRIFGGGQAPSVLDVVKSINANRKDENNINIKRFDRLEKIQKDFLQTARDTGILNEKGIREAINNLTRPDANGQVRQGPGEIQALSKLLNDELTKQTAARQKFLKETEDKNRSILDQQTSNASTFKTAINGLLDYLKKAEAEAKNNSPEGKKEKGNIEKSIKAINDERDAVFGKGFDLKVKKNVSPNATNIDKKIKENAEEFDRLTEKLKIYKKALDGTITLEEANKTISFKQLIREKGITNKGEADASVTNFSEKLRTSKIALEKYDEALKFLTFKAGGTASDQRNSASKILRGGDISAGSAAQGRNVQRRINLLSDNIRQGAPTELLIKDAKELRDAEAKAIEGLKKELELATLATQSFSENINTLGQNAPSATTQASRQFTNIGSFLSGVVDGFSRLNVASENLTTRITQLDSIINDTESTDDQKKAAKTQKENLEAQRKALEAQRNQNVETNTVTESLKSFSGILDFIKKAFDKIKGLFGFKTPPKAVEVTEDRTDFSGAGQSEAITRRNETASDSDIQTQLDEIRLGAYYQLELDLIESTSTAQRRKLLREYDDRLEIFNLIKRQEELLKKQSEGGLSREETGQLQELRKSISRKKNAPDKVTDRIVDALAIDGPEAVQNINDTLVKGAVDFRDALIDGIEAAVVEGKDLKETLRDAATSFLREITRTNLKNAFGGITSLLTGGSNTYGGATTAPQTAPTDPLVVGQRLQTDLLVSINRNTSDLTFSESITGQDAGVFSPQFNPNGSVTGGFPSGSASGGTSSGGSGISNLFSNVGGAPSSAAGGAPSGGSGIGSFISKILGKIGGSGSGSAPGSSPGGAPSGGSGIGSFFSKIFGGGGGAPSSAGGAPGGASGGSGIGSFFSKIFGGGGGASGAGSAGSAGGAGGASALASAGPIAAIIAAALAMGAITKKLGGNPILGALTGIGPGLGLSKLFPKFAEGGMINGGSGSKDDVPALLMGGEYVIKKNAVKKYGPNFMDKVNNGSLPKFASGGLVDPDKLPKQTGDGGYFIPGLRGYGKISGARALKTFATQAFTSGATDFIGSSEKSNAAFIDIEPESQRLTNFGRNAGTPLQNATRVAKGEAFDTALQDDELRRQIKLEEERKKEEFKKALINMAISAVVKAGTSAAMAGSQNAAGPQAGGFEGVSNPNQTAPLQAIPTTSASGTTVGGGGGFWNGVKSFFTGSQIPGGGTQKFGGIGNILNGRGFTTQDNLSSYFDKNPSNPAVNAFFNSGEYINTSGKVNFKPFSRVLSSSVSEGLQSLPSRNNDELNAIEELKRRQNINLSSIYGSDNNSLLGGKKATGGRVRDAAGIDSVPTMLSGGEFVVNSAAANRIGQSSLDRINSGDVSETSDSNNTELIEKVDELIKATKESSGEINITVNSDGSESNSSNGVSDEDEKLNLAQMIKSQVLMVINDEKRMGGRLRGGV
jgi:TP901 family phage tail tape measure protein